MNENATFTQGGPQDVMYALGAPFRHYAIVDNVVDWDEIARLYGERFRDGKLYYFEGETEFDDSSYYQHGEAYVIAAGDVSSVEDTLKKCLLAEIDFTEQELEEPSSEIVVFREMLFSLGSYSEYCDNILLWRHGIVFAYRENTPLDLSYINCPTYRFTAEESKKWMNFLDYSGEW